MGVAFRYLSLDHVSIDMNGRLILSDLSAAVVSDIHDMSTYSSTRDSKSGQSKGSSGVTIPGQYIHTSPPEVLLGECPSASSSVYCAALLAIQILIGESPMHKCIRLINS